MASHAWPPSREQDSKVARVLCHSSLIHRRRYQTISVRPLPNHQSPLSTVVFLDEFSAKSGFFLLDAKSELFDTLHK